jgi:peptide/nickel transport system substrate-binding protein
MKTLSSRFSSFFTLQHVLIFLIFPLLILLLAACGAAKPTPTATTVPTQPQAPTPTPTTAPSAPTSLTVCLGQEPPNLFPLDNPSAAARSVLAAVYDGPIDTNSYGYQPVILQRLPSLQNGDAQLFTKAVYVGDPVVDASNTPVTLTVGTRVLPSGCRDDSCVIVYDGKTEINMDQMQVTFRLLSGLKWSDGAPLSAADSVYAFDLASGQKPATFSSFLVERTQSYEAADDITVQWWGKPGYIDPTYFTNFWFPLPKAQWSEIATANVTTAPETNRTPLGWGAYVIQDWVSGDHISLAKNPNYFRAAEGLPKFDTMTFRFVSNPETAVSDLVAGKCDILDPSIDLDAQVSLLRSMVANKQAQVLFTQPPVMEQLVFAVRPAAYDNGYNPGYDQPNYFADARVRQAVAMCVDRQKVIDSVLLGLTTIPASYVPAEYPLYNSDVKSYAYDVAAANALLEKAGWKDLSNDLTKPRLAHGIPNINDGTPFEVTYLTTAASQRIQVSTLVAGSLAQCGIKVNVEYLDQAALYGVGPDGPLFGRKFDLVEFAMGSTGLEPPCDRFVTSQIPTSSNHWIGSNVSGYSNPAFDKACLAAQESLPDEEVHATAYRQAQSIFTEDLPILPLYWRIRTAAARPGLCNFSLDPTASSSLWNIESFAGSCQP